MIAHRPRHEQRRDEHGERGGPERREEDFRTERHVRGALPICTRTA